MFATVWSATGTPTEVPIPSLQRKIAQGTQGVSDISKPGGLEGFSSPYPGPMPCPASGSTTRSPRFTPAVEVRWIHDVQKVLNTLASCLPTGATLTGIVNLSDNGKLLAQFYGSKGRSFGVLTLQP